MDVSRPDSLASFYKNASVKQPGVKPEIQPLDKVLKLGDRLADTSSTDVALPDHHIYCPAITSSNFLRDSHRSVLMDYCHLTEIITIMDTLNSCSSITPEMRSELIDPIYRNIERLSCLGNDTIDAIKKSAPKELDIDSLEKKYKETILCEYRELVGSLSSSISTFLQSDVAMALKKQKIGYIQKVSRFLNPEMLTCDQSSITMLDSLSKKLKSSKLKSNYVPHVISLMWKEEKKKKPLSLDTGIDQPKVPELNFYKPKRRYFQSTALGVSHSVNRGCLRKMSSLKNVGKIMGGVIKQVVRGFPGFFLDLYSLIKSKKPLESRLSQFGSSCRSVGACLTFFVPPIGVGLMAVGGLCYISSKLIGIKSSQTKKKVAKKTFKEASSKLAEKFKETRKFALSDILNLVKLARQYYDGRDASWESCLNIVVWCVLAPLMGAVLVATKEGAKIDVNTFTNHALLNSELIGNAASELGFFGQQLTFSARNKLLSNQPSPYIFRDAFLVLNRKSVLSHYLTFETLQALTSELRQEFIDTNV